MSVYISLLTVKIPINYAGEFREILKLLHISFASIENPPFARRSLCLIAVTIQP